MEALIRSGLVQLGQAQAVPQEAPALLARYGKLLVEKNQVMNLTAITDPQDVATLHMLDCAALLNCAGFAGKSLIDVGTGAGFPGLALKILVPSLETTLLDSLNKRVDWLNETIDALGLEGAQAIHGRAEEAAREPDLRERFDFAAARAVADGTCEKGIVICTTGIGISIAANKVKGVRCALCSDPLSAEMTRRHNDANMLAMGAGMVGPNLALRMVEVFLATEFEGGRHQERVDMIMAIEERR